MNSITLKQDTYSYGRCKCCDKKFNRRTRGTVMGYSKGKYFLPVNFYDTDTAKEYFFENTPNDIELVKVGYNCSQPIIIEIEKKEREKKEYFETLQQPKKQIGEFKVWTGDNEYHWKVVNKKGIEQILQRGTEYLEYKIKQQKL